MIIYKATNIINRKIYIGQTIKTLKIRLNQHKINAKLKSFNSNYFARAIRKYGFDNFEWEIIDTAESIEELNKKEIYWINFYNSIDRNLGYNSNTGGKNGRPTDEVIKRISEKQKGKIISEETRKKLSIAHTGRITKEEHPMFGKHHSDESKSKMSKKIKGRISTFKGKHHTAESKKLLSESHIGKKASEETRKKISESVKIYQQDEKVRNKMSQAMKGKLVGEKNPMCKYKESDIIKIKTDIKNGISNKEIRQKYTISSGMFYNIKNNVSWKHIIV